MSATETVVTAWRPGLVASGRRTTNSVPFPARAPDSFVCSGSVASQTPTGVRGPGYKLQDKIS